MKIFNYPEVSIVTVNYNGKRFLTSLFKSIKDLDYPPESIQTILVDNASSDGSIDFVKKNFAWVNILQLDKNHGYAGGNNAGMRIAEGDYIALINNDCVVDRSWLKEMVRSALQNEDSQKKGSICSKVLFYYDYIPAVFELNNNLNKKVFLEIKSIGTGKESDHSREKNEFLKYIKLMDGFSTGKNHNYKKGETAALIPPAYLVLPVLDKNDDIRIKFILTAEESANLKITAGDLSNREELKDSGKSVIFSGSIKAGSQILDLKLEKKFFHYKKSMINSCGLEINRAFYARDRYANKWDEGYFENTGAEEVFSPSGSSLLINRKMLEDTGFFDDSFFTYYEDVDLFWRARLMGWKHYFTPHSVVRHHHCGTGVEWSYSFSYHVIRNRLLVIFKCGWTKKVLRCLASFTASVVFNTFTFAISFLMAKKQDRPDIKIRIRIFFELFYLLPKNLIKRIRIRNNATVDDSEIKRWLIDF
jgi:GT2 family glycosyltransferase